MSEEKKTDMSKNVVTIEQAGPCKKKIIIEIPEETIKTSTDEQYESLRKEAQLPGFRKGRAPRRLLEKRFGKDASEQIKLKLIGEASDAAMKDNKVDALGEPSVDLEKIVLPETGALKFDFEVEVRPEFDLPELDNIPVKKTKLEVTPEQVDREIEQLQKWSGIWSPRHQDEKVALDDQIIANAVLTIEGVEESEKLDNTEIYVRHNGFIGAVSVENIDELLVGASVGDVKKTSVELPKTYFREEYRGKKVDIEITVKDIKWLKPAEINEDLLKKYGASTEAELRESLTGILKNRLEQISKEEMASQITRYMLDKTNFDLPTDVVADQAELILRRQYANMIRRGLPQEQLEKEMENIRSASEEQAKQQLKAFFIMDKVAEKLGIDVTEEEINGHIAQVAMQQGQRPERIREQMVKNGSLAQFRLEVREAKCIDKLLEKAKIEEVEAKKPEKAEKPAKKKAKEEKVAEKEEKPEKAPKKTDKKPSASKSTKKSKE